MTVRDPYLRPVRLIAGGMLFYGYDDEACYDTYSPVYSTMIDDVTHV